MSENFYKEIGALLKNAREERLLSIADAGQALHIRMRYLRSLEEGAIHELPGYPYVKGYLNRYAELLGLDKNELMRRFEMAELSSRTPQFFLPHTFSQEKQASPYYVWLGLAGGALVLVLWAGLLRPSPDPLPLVEAVPPKAAPMHKNLPQTPCFKAPETLYPPCYWPVPEPEKSIMTRIK